MNGCFGTIALYTSKDSVNLQLYTDVTSHGTGQELNFDDDTLKGKDSYNC